MKPVISRPVLALVLLVLIPLMAWGARKPKRPPERVLPPKWGSEVNEVFFTDALKQLVGERPKFFQAAPDPGPVVGNEQAAEVAAGGSFRWPELISAEVLEDEIKAQKIAVEQTVTTLGPFKAGAFRECRMQFSVLAVLFAIVDQYDGEVRWKREAAGLRRLFARAGLNCQVATDQSYREATARRDDLVGLVSGNPPAVAGVEDQGPIVWDEVTKRPPLMVRMEIGLHQRLIPALANPGEFSRQANRIAHEAQLLAALAEVIQREKFEYYDDETYLEYARQLKAAASELGKAANEGDYKAARAALGAATQSCTDCHAGYRS